MDKTDNDENWIKDTLESPNEDGGAFESSLILSTDGKHSVIVKSETKEGRKAGLSWAKAVYDKLLVTYGTKQRQAVTEYAKEPKEDLGKCLKCGADNKKSKRGQPYCSKTCWLK